MPIKKKFSKLIVKDASGNLVQLLPETQVDTSLDSISDFPIANSAVASALSNIVKDVAYTSTEPSVSSVQALDNESIIFYETSSSATDAAATPVYTSGNQTISGVKKFVNGLYGNVTTLASNESAFDLSAATCFIKTISANTTLSFTNVPSDVICCITVLLINGGNYTVTWPSSVKWTANQVPNLTSNGKDVLTFVTMDGGTTWFGTTTCIGVTA